MKNKIKNSLLAIVFITVAFLSFYIGLNFYHQYDADRNGQVDIKDLLVVQKYLIEERTDDR